MIYRAELFLKLVWGRSCSSNCGDRRQGRKCGGRNNQVIRRGLGGAVRAVGRIRMRLAERGSVGAKRAVDFIGRYLHEPKASRSGFRQRGPMMPLRCLQQDRSPDDIGLTNSDGPRSNDRRGIWRRIDERSRTVFLQQRGDQFVVANIAPAQTDTGCRAQMDLNLDVSPA